MPCPSRQTHRQERTSSGYTTRCQRQLAHCYPPLAPLTSMRPLRRLCAAAQELHALHLGELALLAVLHSAEHEGKPLAHDLRAVGHIADCRTHCGLSDRLLTP